MNVIQGSALSGEPERDGSYPAQAGASDRSTPADGAYGSGTYGAGGYGSAGYWSGGYGAGGHGTGGYGAGGYGAGGYGAGDSGAAGGRRRRRRGLAFGAAGLALVVAAGVGAYEGLNGGTAPVGKATTSATTELSTSQIAGKVSPALVDINAKLGYQNATSAGTGLVLTPTGEILTNNHVIKGATSISVTDVGNGRTYTAAVVGYDASKDLAVLQLQNASGLATVNLGNSSTVKVGQKVVAIGNAEGKGGTPSVVTGHVLGLNQSITASDASSSSTEQLSGMIETDAPIQPGDSGGPLVDTAGQVVGIDTAASAPSAAPSAQSQAYTPGQSQSGTGADIGNGAGLSTGTGTGTGTGTSAQTQAFSIPINEAVSVAGQIEAGSSSSTVHIGGTAFLGVEVAPSAAGSAGAYGGYNGYGYGTLPSGATIEGVVPGAPAAQAGLSAGDTITSVAGTPITSASQVQTALAGHHPGDKVTIGWTDIQGQAHTATVTLASGPAA